MKKRYIDMTDKEKKELRSRNYFKAQQYYNKQEIISYGREVEADAEYSMMISDIINRYVTIDKVI